MTLSFHGAARTVTGSKHLITLNNGKRLLLDCGLFQGLGSETEELNAHFGFDPASVQLMVLSHAHIDHTGLIPKLVKEGFRGPIFCTEATRQLTEILLHDSAEIQLHEAEHLNRKRREGLPPLQPLYGPEDVEKALAQFQVIQQDKAVRIDPDVEVLLSNAGHLIGSVSVHLRLREGRKRTTLTFSGDIGRYRSVLLQPPAPFPQSDHIILESTYGDKRHDLTFSHIKTLNAWIQRTCVEKGGKLVIPAFSVGRTQEVLYSLNQLSLEKRLPELNYFVDSPLSQKATEVVRTFKDQYNDRLQQVMEIDDDPFDFPGLKFVESADDSRKVVEHDGPCVIVSSSGTADAGRVKHHLSRCLMDEKNGVLMVGYCGPRSVGGQLLSGSREVELFGDPCPVRAEIGQMAGLSAHGDCDDLTQWLSCQDPALVKSVFLVHGEYPVQQAFAARLETKGFNGVIIPTQGAEVNLSKPGRKRTPKAA